MPGYLLISYLFCICIKIELRCDEQYILLIAYFLIGCDEFSMSVLWFLVHLEEAWEVRTHKYLSTLRLIQGHHLGLPISLDLLERGLTVTCHSGVKCLKETEIKGVLALAHLPPLHPPYFNRVFSLKLCI